MPENLFLSSIRWIDVSIPMRNGMVVWPGDVPFDLRPCTRIKAGDSCNTSELTTSTHCGTHMDAPWHFEETGKRLHEIDPAVFFGKALLVEARDVRVVDAPDLGPGPLPPRILLKTRNSDVPVEGTFREDFVAVSGDAAQRLVDEGVKVVGVDYLSVAPYKQPGHETHRRLLSNDVVVVEGLRLQGLAPGTYEFVVLPLRLENADGGPCRAFVGVSTA